MGIFVQLAPARLCKVKFKDLEFILKTLYKFTKMPRGGKRGHKGGRKQFSNPQALEAAKAKEQKEKEWRRARGEEISDTESEEDDEKKSSDEEDDGVAFSKKESESESETESESEDEERKPKGAEGLIQIENPNRVQKKQHKVTTIDLERKEIDKAKAKAHYQKMHAAGKTEEARADLARLAIIRKQREDAAKKRDEEKKAKEEAAKAGKGDKK